MTLCNWLTNLLEVNLLMEEATPSAEQLKTHLLEFADALSEGDLSIVDESFADDYVGHVPSHPGEIRGPDGYKAFVGEFRTAFSDFEITIEDLIVEGEDIACRFTMHGTHEDEFMGIDPTGKSVATDATTFVRFEDGERTEEWGLSDVFGLMQQLGVVESPGE